MGPAADERCLIQHYNEWFSNPDNRACLPRNADFDNLKHRERMETVAGMAPSGSRKPSAAAENPPRFTSGQPAGFEYTTGKAPIANSTGGAFALHPGPSTQQTLDSPAASRILVSDLPEEQVALLFRGRLLHKQDAKQELVCLACQDQDKTRYINLLSRQENIVVLFAFLQVLERVRKTLIFSLFRKWGEILSNKIRFY